MDDIKNTINPGFIDKEIILENQNIHIVVSWETAQEKSELFELIKATINRILISLQ